MGTYSQNDLEDILKAIKENGYAEIKYLHILNYYIKKNTFKSFCDDNNLKATLSNDVYIFELKK